MPDEKIEAHPPPPPYTPYSRSGDVTGTLQQSQESSSSGCPQQEDSTTSKGSSSTLWRRILRRGQVSTHKPRRQQASDSNACMHPLASPTTAAAVANIPRVSQNGTGKGITARHAVRAPCLQSCRSRKYPTPVCIPAHCTLHATPRRRNQWPKMLLPAGSELSSYRWNSGRFISARSSGGHRSRGGPTSTTTAPPTMLI